MTAPIDQAESIGTAAARRALRSTPRLHRWAAMQLERDPLGHGLSLRQLATLLALREGPTPSGLLARQMKVTPAVVTGIADRLERGGYVRRDADATDRRRQFLALTERGHAASSDLLDALTSTLADRFDALPPKDLAVLSRGLVLLEEIVAELDTRPANCCAVAPRDDDPTLWQDDGAADDETADLAATADTDTNARSGAFQFGMTQRKHPEELA